MNVVQTVLLLCDLDQCVSVWPTNRIELQLQTDVVQYVGTNDPLGTQMNIMTAWEQSTHVHCSDFAGADTM